MNKGSFEMESELALYCFSTIFKISTISENAEIVVMNGKVIF